MKSLITISLLLLLLVNLNSQTTDDIPGPERILVVYNENSAISDSIRKHYIRVHGIPESNKLGIDITEPSSYGCEFRWNNEEIVDTTSQGDGGWHYVKEVIADIIVE